MVKLCPKCARPLNAEDYCSHCNLNVGVYKKIKDNSKILYNQGLQKANIRDLSGAIDLLNRSLHLDKHNSNARNLLGLIYFEIGETVSALQQWVVSKNLKPQDNEAIYYLNQVQDNQSYLDKLNTAIKKYNQSLSYIEQGSIDLAIIQLKKVTSLNPKYVKAYGLLALCYIREGHLDKAQKVLKKVLAIDKSNYIARKYLDDMQADTTISDDQDYVKYEDKKSVGMFPKPMKTKANNALFQFVAMAIGVVIGVAIMALMVMPARIDLRESEINTLTADLSKAESALVSTTEENQNLANALKALQSKDDQLTQEQEANVKMLNETTKMVNAINLYMADDLSGAAEGLFLVDDALLSAELSSIYSGLKETVFPTVAEKAYNDGYRAYNRGAFDEGIVYLETSFKYVQDANYSDNALYYLARCHYKKDDKSKALPIFQKLLAEYPDSGNTNDAQYFVNLIEQ